jgi:hypothetical protein
MGACRLPPAASPRRCDATPDHGAFQAPARLSLRVLGAAMEERHGCRCGALGSVGDRDRLYHLRVSLHAAGAESCRGHSRSRARSGGLIKIRRQFPVRFIRQPDGTPAAPGRARLRYATFRNYLTLSSPFNPFADAHGNIFVVPGDHLTGIPDHRFKAGAEYPITAPWKLGADLNVVGSRYLVGDESNQNSKLPAYWLVNLHSSSKVSEHVEVFGLIKKSVRSALLCVRHVLRCHFVSLSEPD